MLRKAFTGSITILFNLLIVFLILWGISKRDDNLITAETGAGYYLGIAGGVLMLLLLIYPLRKRIRIISRFGSVKFWFRTHMLFGILGPVLILFHSNFHTGSLNSTIAMICMLVVAGSGLIGRFLYARIHHGLYGSQIELNEFKNNTQSIEEKLYDELNDTVMNKRLHSIAEQVFSPSISIISSIVLFTTIQIRTRLLFNSIITTLDKRLMLQLENGNLSNSDYEQHKKTLHSLIKKYFISLRKTANYRVSERLFSLWHMLHLPIFFMMLLSAIVHVVVVHMY